MNQTIYHLIRLGGKRPKHSVPDDQRPTIVLVYTVTVTSMVDSMVTGRVKDVLQWSKTANNLTEHSDFICHTSSITHNHK